VKVFVTGATGFVGSHLVEALLNRGDDVATLVRSPAKAQRVFPSKKPRLFPGSLRDPAALRAACEGADVVFHLAGLTAAGSRAEFLEVNEGGTKQVIEAARDVAPDLKRFTHVSSLSAAGPSQRGLALSEDAPARPISAYGMSKLAGEEAVREADLPWTIVRPPAVYGPRDVELRRVFTFARFGIRLVFGDGKQELSLVHVTDLVDALIHAVPETDPGRTYFVCHPELVTAKQLANEIGAVVQEVRTGKRAADGRTRFIVRIPKWFTRPTLAASGFLSKVLGKPSLLSTDKVDELYADAWTCSPAALQRDTGWRASIAIAEGLRDTAQWYRENGFL
jgi:nucleoside-diphosphate-sugar epimerase